MAIFEGAVSGNKAEVTTDGEVKVNSPLDGADAGFSTMGSEIDAGAILGTRRVLSPEVDDDYRLRIATELLLDDETLNYTAQNSGKHNNQSTTMTYSYGTGGMMTNGSSITTTTTGLSLSTYAMFPFFSSGNSVYIQSEVSFSAQPVANTIVDFGAYHRPASNPYAPTDGVYFRLTSAGFIGVVNHNGTETMTAVLDFPYVNSQVYKFLIATNNSRTEFWIDDELYGIIETPAAQAQPFMSAALPYSFRHAIVGGAAGGVFQATLRGYSMSLGGTVINKDQSQIMSAAFGTYQGLSGGTMGSLSSYTNSANPTAAVPSNTALTANLIAGLGGQAWETATLALNADGIILSYQVPAGTVSVQGRRLRITGVKLSSYVQTVIAGGPMNRTFTLNFGHTAVSLATAEAATTKARRVVLLPELTQTITANQAVSTAVSQPGGAVSMFQDPIYVNPGEFVNIAVKHIGTVGTSGTIATNVQLVYSWE